MVFVIWQPVMSTCEKEERKKANFRGYATIVKIGLSMIYTWNYRLKLSSLYV